jgi:hypothetical protein
LTATFVVLFILCFLAALLFPNAELTHNWLSLYSTRPMGSAGQLIEGVIWNVVFAWIAAAAQESYANRGASRPQEGVEQAKAATRIAKAGGSVPKLGQ